jgi:hypothetical protein
MFKHRRLTVVLASLATTAGLWASAPSAGAATPNTTDASTVASHEVVQVVSGQSGLQSETLAQFQSKAAAAGDKITQQSTASPAIVAAASSGCWYYNDWRKGYGIFGQTEWTFNVEPNWCGNGSYITSAYNNTWGSTSWPGWSYSGLIQSTDRYGVGWNVYENVRQGHFCLASYFSCVQNFYPYVDVEVGAGGQVYKN